MIAGIMLRDLRSFTRYSQPEMFKKLVRIAPLTLSDRYVGNWTDISVGGIRVKLDETPKFRVEDVVKLKVQLPNVDRPTMVDARVAWVNETEVGFNFINLNTMSIYDIETAIHICRKSAKSMLNSIWVYGLILFIIYIIFSNPLVKSLFKSYESRNPSNIAEVESSKEPLTNIEVLNLVPQYNPNTKFGTPDLLSKSLAKNIHRLKTKSKYKRYYNKNNYAYLSRNYSVAANSKLTTTHSVTLYHKPKQIGNVKVYGNYATKSNYVYNKYPKRYVTSKKNKAYKKTSKTTTQDRNTASKQ